MNLRDLPLRRKIMAVIMLTSITVVVLTVAAFMIYDLVTIRETTVRNLSTLGQIVGANSTYALTFKNETDAAEVLSSLRHEPQIRAAALYDVEGKLFVTYPRDLRAGVLPAKPEARGYRFEDSHILFFEPVYQGNIKTGTLCLQADLRLFYSRLELYGMLAALILLCSVVLAFWLSNRLQKLVADPILALTHTARQISERRDYTVRAQRSGTDELGLLTDAFNVMLTRIEEQTAAIQESESRLRLALEASRTGTWEWNLQTNRVRWDDFQYALFGLKPAAPLRNLEDFFERIHPEDRESIRRQILQSVEQKTPFYAEFRITWPDDSVHRMMSRGRAFYTAEGKPLRVTGVTTDISDHKKAAEERGFLAAIVESSDDAIIGKDLSGKVVSWNAGAERMLGYSAAEIIGESIERITSPDRPDEEPGILEEVKQGKTRSYETIRVRKDGQPIDISLTVSPIREPGGRIVGASSISKDITARKQAERELQENRARLSGIISSAMDAIISVDSQQRIRLFNTAAEKMFRCAAADAVGKSLDAFIPERFRKMHRDHIQEFGKTGTTARAMGHLRPLAGRRQTGEEFPIEASISHIDVAGEQIYTVILRDITERVQAQESLEMQAGVLREQAQMLDLANVMARDLDDRIILWNTGMERMYGWLRTETLGQESHHVLRTVFPIPLEQIKAALSRDGSWEGELIHTRKDGKKLTVASQWVLHRDKEGQPAAVLEVNTDITERKQAEQQVIRMNTELEQRVQERTSELTDANQELEAFTYSVAHDLRAPLRHIDAFTRIIFEDFFTQIPAEARHYLENIRKGSQNMSRLVDDLLNLARVSRQELQREAIPLGPLVQDVIADLHRDTENRDVEWRVKPLPTVISDPGLIKQVFANLLSNAVKYTRPRAHAFIEVGERELNGRPVLYVQDNGVGFSMKYSDKLFGVFQRLHRADEFEGTGVGLATVERIIRKHGGRIWAESEVDRGATFYFTFDGLTRSAHNGRL